jgi:hypothetical protein
MSALDSVLGFFRQNEDDLEATDQPESPSELQSDGSLRFGGMGAPFGFLTSEYDPVASANSLAGPVYSDSIRISAQIEKYLQTLLRQCRAQL